MIINRLAWRESFLGEGLVGDHVKPLIRRGLQAGRRSRWVTSPSGGTQSAGLGWSWQVQPTGQGGMHGWAETYDVERIHCHQPVGWWVVWDQAASAGPSFQVCLSEAPQLQVCIHAQQPLLQHLQLGYAGEHDTQPAVPAGAGRATRGERQPAARH